MLSLAQQYLLFPHLPMYDIHNLPSFSTVESYLTISPSQYFATVYVDVDGPARTLTVVKNVVNIFNIELFFF